MTEERKNIESKLALLKLADQLGSVTQDCKVMGYSRESYYHFKVLFEQQGKTSL